MRFYLHKAEVAIMIHILKYVCSEKQFRMERMQIVGTEGRESSTCGTCQTNTVDCFKIEYLNVALYVVNLVEQTVSHYLYGLK